MGDIIALYNQQRMRFKDNPRAVLHATLGEERWQKAELEHLASHLANCASNGSYPQREAIYPLIDLESMVRLKDERGIVKTDVALKSVYDLLDDYLLPKNEQKYRFTPYDAVEILKTAINLGLAKMFDTVYVQHVTMAATESSYKSDLERQKVLSALTKIRIEVVNAKK